MTLKEIADCLDKAADSQDKENILYFLEQAHHNPAVIDNKLLSNLVILIGQTKRWLYPFENERDNLIWLEDFDDLYRKSELNKYHIELIDDLHFLTECLRSIKENKVNQDKIPGQSKLTEQQKTANHFTFHPGQALFKGDDLNLPTGIAIDVLKKLVENFGAVVVYEELDMNSSVGQAEEQLRSAKSKIVNCLKTKKVPCEIKTKQREGYVISLASCHK